MEQVQWKCPGCSRVFYVPSTEGLTVCSDCQRKLMAVPPPIPRPSSDEMQGVNQRGMIVVFVVSAVVAGMLYYLFQHLKSKERPEAPRQNIETLDAQDKEYAQALLNATLEKHKEARAAVLEKLPAYLKEEYGTEPKVAAWYPSFKEIEVTGGRLIIRTRLPPKDEKSAEAIAEVAEQWLKENKYANQVSTIVIKDANSTNLLWTDLRTD